MSLKSDNSCPYEKKEGKLKREAEMKMMKVQAKEI